MCWVCLIVMCFLQGVGEILGGPWEGRGQCWAFLNVSHGVGHDSEQLPDTAAGLLSAHPAVSFLLTPSKELAAPYCKCKYHGPHGFVCAALDSQALRYTACCVQISKWML